MLSNLNKRSKTWLRINLLIYSAILILFTFIGFREYNFLKDNAEQQLKSIANLKNEAISSWYNDQISDINTIAESELFQHFLNKEGSLTENDSDNILQSYLSTIKIQHDIYNLFLIDINNQLLISATEKVINYNEFNKSIQEAIVTKQVISTQILTSPEENLLYIAYIKPVVKNEEVKSLLICIIDVNSFLTQSVDHWPVPTKTAESFLIQFDTDKINVLNFDTENDTRFPIKQQSLQEIYMRNAQSGFIKTIDYHQKKSWAYYIKIDATPWYIILKLNTSEIFTNLKYLIISNLIIIVIIIFLIFLLSAYTNSISQQKTLHGYIEKQNEYIKTLNSIGEGVISIDLHGKITYINEIAANLLNKSVKELLHKKLRDEIRLFSFKDQNEVKMHFHDYFKHRETQNFNYKLLLSNQDKNLTPVLLSGYPIINDEEEIKGGVIIIRDESKEHSLLLQLEKNSRQLNNVLSNIPGAAYKCKNNKDYDFEYLSNRIIDITGYHPSEFIDEHTITYGQVINEEYRDYVWETIQNSIKDNKTFVLEYKITTKDHLEKWIWEQGIGVYNKQGEFDGLSGILIDISDQKKKEFELAESQNLYETLTKNSAVGIFRVDVDGHVIFINPKLCELTEYQEEDLLGNSILDFLSEKDQAIFRELTANEPSPNFSIDTNIKLLKKSAEQIWIRALILPEYNLEQQHIGYTGNIINITEQIKIQEELSSNHKFLRTVIDNLPDAIYMKDLEGRKVISNKTDYIDCGFNTEEEILNKNDFDIFPKSTAEIFWKDDQLVLTSGKPIINQEQISDNNNHQERIKLVSKIPQFDRKGNIIGLIGINRDITEIKHTQSENRILQEAITQIPISVIISDKDGKIEYVNAHFTNLIGYQPEEVIGKTQSIFQSGKTSPETYQTLWSTIESGNIWVGELLNKKKDGTYIWESVTIAPILNSHGEIIKYISLKENITQKKELMKELTIAKEKAEQSDRLKTSFLANMSHEIRTPLNAILGFTQLIADSDLSQEETDSYLRIIDRSAETLVNIINDIIDISSIETGTIKIHKRNVEINTLLKTINKQFEQKFNDKTISSNELKLVCKDEISLTIDENRTIAGFH